MTGFVQALKQLALDTIENYYLENHRLRIYIDGSKEEEGKFEAGIYSLHFKYFFPVGSNTTNFDIEIETI